MEELEDDHLDETNPNQPTIKTLSKLFFIYDIIGDIVILQVTTAICNRHNERANAYKKIRIKNKLRVQFRPSNVGLHSLMSGSEINNE